MSDIIDFEHSFREKILHQSFRPFEIKTKQDISKWRSAWMQALSKWHSPYKTLINAENLKVVGDPEELREPFELMEKFFKGLYLKKAVVFGPLKDNGLELLPFEGFDSEVEAMKALGVRDYVKPKPGDFRSSLQFENHFRQHVIELTFAQPVVFDSNEKWQTLRAKLTNNLMQWHSAWSLLVDCSQVEFKTEFNHNYGSFERYVSGFFCKRIIGHSTKGPKETYPFPVYRARHRAAAELESEGLFSGEDADCLSRKSQNK